MNKLACNEHDFLFAGDYEVVGPDPALGFDVVSGMGVGMVLIHYHHRHEFQGGGRIRAYGGQSAAGRACRTSGMSLTGL